MNSVGVHAMRESYGHGASLGELSGVAPVRRCPTCGAIMIDRVEGAFFAEPAGVLIRYRCLKGHVEGAIIPFSLGAASRR